MNFLCAASILLVSLLAACGGSSAAETGAPTSTAAPAGETLAKDTRRATPAGATFTAPAGWALVERGNAIVLDPPEGDSHVAIIDVDAKDADDAIARGWAAYRPDFKRPLKLSMPQAARNGWEERRYYEYETSPNERVTIYALAWRAGRQWIAIVIDATEPTFEKRSAPISLALQSLRPKGYQRESFAGKKAHRLDATRIRIMQDFVAQGMKELGVLASV